MKRICVFCGSSIGSSPAYVAAARALGELLCDEGIGLVYGGASVGLMGILADTVLERRGEAIGVMPRHLLKREVGHTRLADLRVVESMHERKALMAELADGFIAMPGGFGTFEEMFEIITWAQLGLHGKPAGFLNVAGYYDPLLGLIEHGVTEGFVREAHRGLILHAADPGELLQRMRSFVPIALPKWLERPDQT